MDVTETLFVYLAVMQFLDRNKLSEDLIVVTSIIGLFAIYFLTIEIKEI